MIYFYFNRLNNTHSHALTSLTGFLFSDKGVTTLAVKECKVHAKHNSSKNFFSRFFIHQSIENFTPIKKMCSLKVLEALVPPKNQKNLAGVKNSTFRKFSVKFVLFLLRTELDHFN